MTRGTKLILRITLGVLMLLLIAPFIFQLYKLYSGSADGTDSMGGLDLGMVIRKYWWFICGAVIIYIGNLVVMFWKTKEEDKKGNVKSCMKKYDRKRD